jgi:hypothetical protein
MNDDENPLGNGPISGGALTLPFARRWAVDHNVTHVRAGRGKIRFLSGGNRACIAPAVQHCRRGQRSCWSSAFGAGFTAGGI